MYPLSLQDKATIKNSRPEDLLKRLRSLRGAEQIQEHTADDDERDGNHPDEAQPLAKEHGGNDRCDDEADAAPGGVRHAEIEMDERFGKDEEAEKMDDQLHSATSRGLPWKKEHEAMVVYYLSLIHI